MSNLGGGKEPLGGGSFIDVAIVVGNGTKGSMTGVQDKSQVGLHQFKLAGWGNDVNNEDIPLSGMVVPDHLTRNNALDHGQLCYVMRHGQGNPQVTFIGSAGNLLNHTQSIPGNQNLMQAFSGVINFVDEFMRKKPIKFVDARKYKTKKPDPNTEKYRHIIKQGIHTASELVQMAGFKMPSITNIPTAVSQFANIINPSSFGSIPGMNMSLGNSLKKLSNSDKRKIQDNVTPELWEIILSLIDQLEQISDEDLITYISDTRVNEEVFIKNAVELLSQVTSISDIMEVFDRLQTDITLHGLDELNEIRIEIETAYGNVVQIISANGNSNTAISNTVANTMSTLSNNMKSSSAFPAGFGQNIFGRDAQQIFDMINRMAPQGQKQVIDTLMKAIPDSHNKHSMNNTHDCNAGRRPLAKICTQIG